MITPTEFDLECIEDLSKAIRLKLAAIGDSGADDLVRLPFGDSRPEPVREIKARIEEQREAIRRIQRRFPEYFAL